ncbi:hypothetical protein ElyMa_003180500 [Elysia marginata]|uniref:PIN domain-containing protein n=1 Tax=Elysia marginata TaxID=1093978 RepID=A0AAV4IXB3_9GAST|nr:hypothetical protein ElyMa_003180500 [Elysia marginata]
MAGGLPHRLRFKMFNTRYRLFVGGPRQARRTEPSREETKAIRYAKLFLFDASLFLSLEKNILEKPAKSDEGLF